MGIIFDKRLLRNDSLLFSVSYVVGTRWNCLIEAIRTCTNKICSVDFEILHYKCLFSTNFSIIGIVLVKWTRFHVV